MSKLCLSAEEIREITGKVRFTAQARELNRLGIDNKHRADGSVLVFRSSMEPKASLRKSAAPDFEAINNVA